MTISAARLGGAKSGRPKSTRPTVNQIPFLWESPLARRPLRLRNHLRVVQIGLRAKARSIPTCGSAISCRNSCKANGRHTGGCCQLGTWHLKLCSAKVGSNVARLRTANSVTGSLIWESSFWTAYAFAVRNPDDPAGVSQRDARESTGHGDNRALEMASPLGFSGRRETAQA